MALTKEDLGQISKIVTLATQGLARESTMREEIALATAGLAKESTVNEQISNLRDDLRGELRIGLDSVKNEIKRVQSMLEEDYSAESDRLTRLSRRLDRTRTELKQHIAGSATHSQTNQTT